MEVDYKKLVKSEIDDFNAFRIAQDNLVFKYENLIEKLYEYAPIIITVGDFNNLISPFIYINKFASKELGYDIHKLLKFRLRGILELIHNTERYDFLKAAIEFTHSLSVMPVDEGDKLVFEQVNRVMNSEGNYIWYNIRSMLLSRKSDGTPHLFLSILSNVNDSVSLQEEKNKRMQLEISLLHEKVNVQNEKLHTQLLASIESNKYWHNVIKYIEKIEINKSDDLNLVLKQVVTYIERNQPNSNAWDDFISRFQDINPYFVQFLAKNFPDLTPTEIKICSLTRTGLNSKDIASILKLSSRSIENHKYNIRRKFKLEPYQNLYNYINAL